MKKIIVFLGFVLTGLLVVSSTGVPLQGAIPAAERAALIALYNATNGDNWTDNSGWKTPPLHTDGFAMPGTEDTWKGISITGDHVIYIMLDDNNLSGSIPSELGNLSNLKWLNLSGNQLSGSIPPELGNLSSLESLVLYSNRLGGSIPPALGNLSSLRGLFLEKNQLSGSIPSELGNLSNLDYLWLNSNQLTGNIPSSLTNLTNLNTANIGYNGLYTNDNTLRTFLNGKHPGWEDTQTIAPGNVSAASISTSSIRVSWTPIFYTWDTGGYKVYYSTTSGGPYTPSGMTADKFTSFYDVTGLNPGTTYYLVVNTQTDSHSDNDNTVVSEFSGEVSTATGSLEEKDPPFGSFSTPIDGSTAVSSIPVTGWALDDTGIDSVKIYRAQDSSLVYIGDALLVEGARPDVADAYPQYPNNTRAGWGYMLLTNFLPNGGNGTFTLYAVATDFMGKSTTLGSKTIHCDNAHAVKPFGAIDTPAQGGTASGSSFRNNGWVLTPQPDSIPIDGSTINVYVDGVNLGHPTYNGYRSDIADLFPGYANSNGAAGYFYLDTTAYSSGVHTIFWTASDSSGDSDGIGSRYFTIQNSAERTTHSAEGRGRRKRFSGFEMMSAAQENPRAVQIGSTRRVAVDYSVPVRIIKGFKEHMQPEVVTADENGIIRINIKEVERIEIHLTDEYSNPFIGYLLVNKRLIPLPVGSTLDSQRGIFCWVPGPAFIGEYFFVFIRIGKNGMMSKKEIIVTIAPKFTNRDDTGNSQTL